MDGFHRSSLTIILTFLTMVFIVAGFNLNAAQSEPPKKRKVVEVEFLENSELLVSSFQGRIKFRTPVGKQCKVRCWLPYQTPGDVEFNGFVLWTPLEAWTWEGIVFSNSSAILEYNGPPHVYWGFLVGFMAPGEDRFENVGSRIIVKSPAEVWLLNGTYRVQRDDKPVEIHVVKRFDYNNFPPVLISL